MIRFSLKKCILVLLGLVVLGVLGLLGLGAYMIQGMDKSLIPPRIKHMIKSSEETTRSVKEGDVVELLHELYKENVTAQDVFVVGAGCGCKKLVHMLLPIVEINESNKHGLTALGVAAGSGETEMVKFLIEHGADPNDGDAYGRLPLHFAVFYGHKETVKALLNAGAQINARGFKLFPSISDYEKRLIAARFKRVEPELIALGIAIERKHDELVSFLIDAGADINALYGKNELPLVISAIDTNNAQALDLLLKNGANPNTRDKKGRTALMNAVIMCNRETAKILLEHGADPNAIDTVHLEDFDFDETALDIAVFKDFRMMAELLTKYGATGRMRRKGTRVYLVPEGTMSDMPLFSNF